MPQFLKDLYEKNKALAWIVGIVVIPVVILFFFKDFAMMFLAKGAQKDVDNAVAKDKEIQKEVDAIKTEVTKHEAKADLLDKQANEVKNDKDEDWHKSRGSATIKTMFVMLLLVSVCLYGLFLQNTYENHYPVASEGDCVVFDMAEVSGMNLFGTSGVTTAKVVGNNMSAGEMQVEVFVQISGITMTINNAYIGYAEIRRANYEVIKGCQSENSN